MSSTVEVVEKTCLECGTSFEFESAGKLDAFRCHCDGCCTRLEVEAAERDAAAKADRRRKASLIPLDLQGVDFADLEIGGNLAPHSSAEKWGAGEVRGLVLHGPVGVGKTTLAAAAAWKLLERRYVRWSSVPAVIADSFGDDKAKHRAARTLTGSGALVLDDIDKVKAGDWVASQLFAAIDGRVTHGAPLIVTTNLRVSQLAAKLGDQFGDAIASRLAGYCEIHEVQGRDRRLS
jgi:DNA replication protein DnaC